MDRINKLNFYQKAILLIMLAMALVFAPVYHKTVSKVGYEYRDEVLVQSVENGNTVYSGKIKGEQACFTVSEDKKVSFEYGDKSYGPYTMTQDPTAVPEDEELSERMSGVEIREGEKSFSGAEFWTLAIPIGCTMRTAPWIPLGFST